MKLTNTEVKIMRSQGLHIVDRCDRCGTVLNQSHRYTVAGKPGAYCTAACRDGAFLGAKAGRVIQGTRCFRCHQYKAPGENTYCERCQPFADPHAETVEAQELPCEVCGEPVPALRRGSGSTTYDARCAETLKKRRQRNRNVQDLTPRAGFAPQFTDSLSAQTGTF